MTAPLLHRFCPDHDPDTALCGLDVTDARLVIDPDDAAEALAAGDPCVVCADLNWMACEDACLALREATA